MHRHRAAVRSGRGWGKGHGHGLGTASRNRARPSPTKTAGIADAAHGHRRAAGVVDGQSALRGRIYRHAAEGQTATQGNNPRGRDGPSTREGDGASAGGFIRVDSDVPTIAGLQQGREGDRYAVRTIRCDGAVPGWTTHGKATRVIEATYSQRGVAGIVDRQSALCRRSDRHVAEGQIAAQRYDLGNGWCLIGESLQCTQIAVE